MTRDTDAMPPSRPATRRAGPPPLVAIDANLLDRDGSPRDAWVDAFQAAVASGRIRVFVPSGVVAEWRHPNTPQAVKAAVAASPFDMATLPREPGVVRGPTARQHIDRIRVRAVMRGDGRPGKHDADAAHLSEASEAGCRFFVTRDGKILRKRDSLRIALPPGLRIVTIEDVLLDLDREG